MNLHNYIAILVTVLCCLTTNINSQFRLYNGEPSSTDDRRYMVALLWQEKYYCAGSLVSMQMVITAEICLKGLDTDLIKVAANVANAETFRGPHRKVKEVFCSTDIAGIELVKSFNENDGVWPISLCKKQLSVGEKMETSGWSPQEESQYRFKLVEKDVTIVTAEECANYQQPIKQNMYCAKGLSGVCDGDFGAPGVVGGQLCGVEIFSIDEHDESLRFYVNAADPEVLRFIEELINKKISNKKSLNCFCTK